MSTTPQIDDNPTDPPDAIETPVEKEDTPEQPNPTTLPKKEKTPPNTNDIDIDTELERGTIFLVKTDIHLHIKSK